MLFREPICQVNKEPPIYLDAVKPCDIPAPPSPGTFLEGQEDYADIWLPGEDGQFSSSGYRTLSGDTTRRAESISLGSCIVHGTTTLSDTLSPPPMVRVTSRTSPSPRHVFREGSGGCGGVGGCNNKEAGNMYSYGALEPGWAIWREQSTTQPTTTTTGEDGQRTTSILV